MTQALIKALAIQPVVWFPYLVALAPSGLRQMTPEYDFIFLMAAYQANFHSILVFWKEVLDAMQR